MDRRQLLPCLVGAALTGCGKKGRQPHRLRVGLIPRWRLAPVYLAHELGFFQEAGLKVDFHRFAGHLEMLLLLAGGALEVGFNWATGGFINAVLKGARLRIVASRDIAVPGCDTGGVIFGYRKSFPQGLHDLRLLKGKRVAVHDHTDLGAFFLDQILASAGMSSDDVKLLSMGSPEAATALMGGKIDAVPTASLDKDLDFVSANVVRSITLSELLPNYQYTFVLFGPALLDGAPEIGVSFLEAYLRGVRAYRAGQTPRALEELALAGHNDPAAARAVCRESISRDGTVDRASVQRFVDWAAKKGFIPRAVDASQLIDTRFVEEALRRLNRRSGSTR